MKFGESDFGDLIASAEQLTADIDGGQAGDLPRYRGVYFPVGQSLRLSVTTSTEAFQFHSLFPQKLMGGNFRFSWDHIVL